MSFGDDVAKANKKHKPHRTYPPGTLVTGWNANGLFGAVGHRGHLFETGEVRPSNWSNSGYLQSARCVVCNEWFAPCDSEFWEVRASKEEIDQCINLIAKQRRQLLKACRELAAYDV